MPGNIETHDMVHLQKISRVMYNAGRSSHLEAAQQPLSAFRGEEFCRFCTAPNNVGYVYCGTCHKTLNQMSQEHRPNQTAYLTFAFKKHQSGLDIRNYKDGINGGEPSEDSMLRMKILVAFFTKYHASCLRNFTGHSITGLATVPSAKGRKEHPLDTDLSPYLPIHKVSVRRTAPPRSGRDVDVDPGRYHVDSNVSGVHVLVFEDTWVSGAQALSVAAALKIAGATTVSILGVARLLNPAFEPTQKWMDQAGELRSYDPTFCPVTRSDSCPVPLVAPHI